MTRQRLLVVAAATFAVGLTVWLAILAWVAASTCCGLTPLWFEQAIAVTAGLNAISVVAFEFARLARQSPFGAGEINTEGIGMEIRLTKENR